MQGNWQYTFRTFLSKFSFFVVTQNKINFEKKLFCIFNIASLEF